ALAGSVALVLWLTGRADFRVFAAAALVELAFALPLRARVRHVMAEIEVAGHDLDVLSLLLARNERESFARPLLVRRSAALPTRGMPPSRRIARLRRLIELLDARRNQLFTPLSFLWLWATQLTHGIESWRAASGAAVPRWLDAVGEFEALCALAGFAYENPADPFPDVIASDGGPVFEGDALGHPLI